MRQRQRFDLWIETQKRLGAPQVDPLTLSDIRAATGVYDEETDAVTSNAALTVANLLRLIIDPETHARCGVAVRRGGGDGRDAAVVVLGDSCTLQSAVRE